MEKPKNRKSIIARIYETKEIKFDYLEITEDMITNVEINEMSEDVLELDFNGDIRRFKKEKES